MRLVLLVTAFLISAPLLNKLHGQTGIPCNTGTFFGMDVNHNVIEYQLAAGVATAVDTILYSIPGGSLAYCNNIDGGAFSPTFYTTTSFNVYRYNGTSWDSDSLASTLSFGGIGGNGNNLYFTKPELMIYSAGATLTQVSALQSVAADVAVDDDGNAWYLTGPVATQASAIRVISPTGVTLKSYPINLNTNNAYGMFLLDAVLYIGFGQMNTAHSYCLLPISFSGNNAIIGTDIIMPHLSTYDLASCSPGNPLAIEENSANNYFNFYPNPSSDFIMLSLNEGNSKIRIYNSNGVRIMQFVLDDNNPKINLQALAPGFYFIECENSRGVFRKKLLKV